MVIAPLKPPFDRKVAQIVQEYSPKGEEAWIGSYIGLVTHTHDFVLYSSKLTNSAGPSLRRLKGCIPPH